MGRDCYYPLQSLATVALHAAAAFRCIGSVQLSPCYVLISHQNHFYILKTNSRLTLIGRLQQQLSELHWNAHAYSKMLVSHVTSPLLCAIYSLTVYIIHLQTPTLAPSTMLLHTLLLSPVSICHLTIFPLSPVPTRFSTSFSV